MIAFFKRCWQRRWIRGLAWTFVTLLTLLMFFMVWVNWTGARVWQEAQQRIRDEKLTLDFRQTLPDPVPDAENFCATPLLRDIGVVVDREPEKGEPAAKRRALAALGLPNVQTSPTSTEQPSVRRELEQDPGKFFGEWANWLRESHVPMPVTDPQHPAREVLAALSHQDAAVAEMAGMLDRPRAQFQPPRKTEPLPEMLFSMQLPHFNALRDASDGLALRAAAAVHAGEAAKAHETARILVRLTQAVSDEPFLIGLLVANSIALQASDSTWEICKARAGTGEDFLKLQRDFERLDLQRAALRAWESELAGGVDAIAYLKRTRDPNFLLILEPKDKRGDSEESAMERVFTRMLPSGFFDMNATNMVHMELDYGIRPLRDRGWQGVLKLQPEMERRLKLARAEWPTNLDKIFPCLFMPAATSLTATSVYSQCRVNQAIIACALEHYFTEHKAYPDTLASLNRSGAPALPLDPANSEPMRYRKTDDGRYKLWSVGFDLVDDGGKAAKKGSDGRSVPNRFGYEGDWVWAYATGN